MPYRASIKPESLEGIPGNEEIVETAGYVNKETQIAMYTDAGMRYDQWLEQNFESGYRIDPTDDEDEYFPEMQGRRVTELDVLQAKSFYEDSMEKSKKVKESRKKSKNEDKQPVTPAQPPAEVPADTGQKAPDDSGVAVPKT